MRIKYKVFEAGHCRHPERTTLAGAGYGSVEFPALCFLLHHPSRGPVLFDTGFSSHFLELCKKWPGRLYSLLLPVNITSQQDIAVQLREKAGIGPEDVKAVIISHFHNDHVAGLVDFPAAEIICSRAGYDAVRRLGSLSGIRHGISPELFPQDMGRRLSFIEDRKAVGVKADLSALPGGYDIFNDGAIAAIPLPGHAPGHYGLFFHDDNDRPILLAADACWSSTAYRELRMPHPVTRLVHHDWAAYRDTIGRLHGLSQLNKDILIIPSHCREFSAHD